MWIDVLRYINTMILLNAFLIFVKKTVSQMICVSVTQSLIVHLFRCEYRYLHSHWRSINVCLVKWKISINILNIVREYEVKKKRRGLSGQATLFKFNDYLESMTPFAIRLLIFTSWHKHCMTTVFELTLSFTKCGWTDKNLST